MYIALDAMGGDNAPHTIVEGTILAAKRKENTSQFILVGNEKTINQELAKHNVKGLSISIVHASEAIDMNESPAQALRKKKDSSISVATKLQKEGKVDALVSAGNTGAVMASCLLGLGRLKGVLRPAIATFVPTEKGVCILLDVGANVNSRPTNLLQFAVMGSIYAQYVFDRENPKVGLLSVGEESSKGDELTVAVHQLLSTSSLNFIGNLEGRDILKGKADVVVCDGFVGNVILKFAESVLDMLTVSIKEYVYTNLRSRIGAFLLKPAMKEFGKKMNYEEYGGAPLLGIDGVCIVCHGRSSAKAIMNAIRVAERFIERKVNDHIKEQLQIYSEERE